MSTFNIYSQLDGIEGDALDLVDAGDLSEFAATHRLLAPLDGRADAARGTRVHVGREVSGESDDQQPAPPPHGRIDDYGMPRSARISAASGIGSPPDCAITATIASFLAMLMQRTHKHVCMGYNTTCTDNM